MKTAKARIDQILQAFSHLEMTETELVEELFLRVEEDPRWAHLVDEIVGRERTRGAAGRQVADLYEQYKRGELLTDQDELEEG